MRKIKSKIKISACYIVKNESKNLSRSIESLKNAVDEIVIVDTGSTDETIKIAQSYNAKIIQTQWNNDFSTPRNLAINNAKGDWIVMIDADEFFINPKFIRPTIEKLSDNDAIFIRRIDIDEDNDNQQLNQDYYLRAFRNVDYLRFCGLIHENIENLNGGSFKYQLADDSLTLLHTGYSQSKSKLKLERNLKIINEEINQIGIKPRHRIALVDCYYALEDYQKVIENARELIKLNVKPITGLLIFYKKTLHAMRILNLPLTEILKVLEEALKEFPNDEELKLQDKMFKEYLRSVK